MPEPMNDNARIVREALEFYAEPLAWVRSQMVFPRPEPEKDLMCEGPSPADTDRGDEARAALVVVDALESELDLIHAELESTQLELATAKADLERAREVKILDFEKIVVLLTGDRLRVQIDSPIGWVTIASEGIIREELRAALAPEQKGVTHD